MVTAAEKKRREALAAKLAGKSAPADDDTLGNPADFDTDAEGSVKEEADTIVPPVDPGSGTGEVGEAARAWLFVGWALRRGFFRILLGGLSGLCVSTLGVSVRRGRGRAVITGDNELFGHRNNGLGAAYRCKR